MDTKENPYIKGLLIPPAFPSDFTLTPIKVGCSYATNLTTGRTTKKRYYISEIWGRKVEPKQYKPSIYSPPVPPALEYIKKLQKISNPFDDLRRKLNLYDSPVIKMVKDMQKATSPLDSIIKTNSYISSLSSIMKPMDLGFKDNSIIRTNTGLSDLLNYENTYIDLCNSIDVYGQSRTATQYDKVIQYQKELARKYKKAQSKKSKKQLLKEIEKLQNDRIKDKQKNKKLKANLSSAKNENKALLNALGSLQASFDEVNNYVDALPPPMTFQPQQMAKKPEILTLDSNLHTHQIQKIHKYGNSVFVGMFEQWKNLFSSNIQPMQPIKLRQGTTLMDLRLFIDELIKRGLIENTEDFLMTIEKSKAFIYGKKIVTSKMLRIDKRGMYPNTKNYNKVQAIFKALRTPPNKE